MLLQIVPELWVKRPEFSTIELDAGVTAIIKEVEESRIMV